MSQTKAAQQAGCDPRTVRRYVRDGKLKVDEKKQVSLIQLEDLWERGKPQKSGRRVEKLANPLTRSMRVNDLGQMFLGSQPIFAWNGSGNAIPLKGEPCAKGCLTVPHPKDQKRACRILELQLFAHLRIDAERIIRYGLNTAMLADAFVSAHSIAPFPLLQTPRQVTEQGHHVFIRHRLGCFVEITSDESGMTIRESLVSPGNELGTLLPLAYQLDQFLAGCPSHQIRVLTALFICDVLRLRKPDGRRYCATKEQRKERDRYWKIRDSALPNPPQLGTPIDLEKARRAFAGKGEEQTPQQQQMWNRNTERRMRSKHMNRLGGLVHESVTRHGYTLEWMLQCSRPTALYWRRKLSPLLKDLKAAVNKLRRPQVPARPSHESEDNESVGSYIEEQAKSQREVANAIRKARTPKHFYNDKLKVAPDQ